MLVDTPPDYEYLRFERTTKDCRMNSRERSAVAWFLSQQPSNSWVLDVPCGMGRFSDLVYSHGHHLCSVDLNLKHARYASRRIPDRLNLTVQGNAMVLPFRDSSMEAVICVRLIHHLEEGLVLKVLAEFSRVAPEVFLSFYNANAWKMWKKRIRRKHTRAKSYSVSQMREMAAAVGLRIVAKRPRTGLFPHNQFLWLRRDKIY